MQKILSSICVLFCSIILAACTNSVRQSSVSPGLEPPTETIQDHQIVAVNIGDSSLFVEAVTTAESITKGLGGRDEIGSDGMLFVLPERRVANFWMHGMEFPLDFVWIDGDKVVGVLQNIPAPENPQSSAIPSYSSEVTVTHVLELPAGDVQALGISEGMTVQYNY